MGDKVMGYTLDGYPVAEIIGNVSRQWQLTRTHRAERGVLSVNSDDYGVDIIKYMNYVVVFGNDVVPNWVGYMSPPKTITDNVTTIQLQSAEYLLASRRLPYSGDFSGSGTAVFSELINKSKRGNTDIITGINTEGGSNSSYTVEYQRQSVFDEINNLADAVQSYWWIDPRGAANDRPGNFTKLSLVAKYSRSRGVDYPHNISETVNFTNVNYSEVSPLTFANTLYMQGFSNSEDDPIEVTVRDDTSISKYGVMEDIVNISDATTAQGLVTRGLQELQRRAQPRIQVQGDVTLTPYPRIGDKIVAELFARRFRPINLIVKKVAYSPLYESVNIVADNIFWS